jgi:hypothetical protein
MISGEARERSPRRGRYHFFPEIRLHRIVHHGVASNRLSGVFSILQGLQPLGLRSPVIVLASATFNLDQAARGNVSIKAPYKGMRDGRRSTRQIWRVD